MYDSSRLELIDWSVTDQKDSNLNRIRLLRRYCISDSHSDVMAMTTAQYWALGDNLDTAAATGLTSVSMATSMYSLCSVPASTRWWVWEDE